MNKILLTCVGKSDPLSKDGENWIPGPILTTLEEKKFAVVVIIWAIDPDMNARTSKLAEEIKQRYPDIKVEMMGFECFGNPTDFYYLRDGMYSVCLQILDVYHTDEYEYSIQMSSGTPQMQWTWIALTYTGLIPAKLFAVRRRTLDSVERPYVYEVNLKDIGDLADNRIVRLEEEVKCLKRSRIEDKAQIYKMQNTVSKVSENNSGDEIPIDFDLEKHLLNEKRRFYLAALAKYPDNMAEAARVLGLKPATFRKAIRENLLNETD